MRTLKFWYLVANLMQEIQELRSQTDFAKAAQIEQKVENFEIKNRLSDREDIQILLILLRIIKRCEKVEQ